MLSTKTRKIISIMMIAMMIMFTVSNICMAATSSGLGGIASDMTGDTNGPGTTNVQNIGKNIIGFLQVAGVVVAVIILVVIGIKYIMGSAEEKAEYKKTLIPYLVGAVLIAAAPFIASAVFNFAGSVKA